MLPHLYISIAVVSRVFSVLWSSTPVIELICGDFSERKEGFHSDSHADRTDFHDSAKHLALLSADQCAVFYAMQCILSSVGAS